jgi:hypothetical protein
MFGTRPALSMHERACGEWQLSTANTHLEAGVSDASAKPCCHSESLRGMLCRVALLSRINFTAPLFALVNSAASGYRNEHPKADRATKGAATICFSKSSWGLPWAIAGFICAALTIFRLADTMSERVASGLHIRSRDTSHQSAKASNQQI